MRVNMTNSQPGLPHRSGPRLCLASPGFSLLRLASLPPSAPAPPSLCLASLSLCCVLETPHALNSKAHLVGFPSLKDHCSLLRQCLEKRFLCLVWCFRCFKQKDKCGPWNSILTTGERTINWNSYMKENLQSKQNSARGNLTSRSRHNREGGKKVVKRKIKVEKNEGL